jgi:hypothetical protein
MLAKHVLLRSLPDCSWSQVGPHFTDKGYNALDLSNAANMWVSGVTFVNCDNAIFTDWVDSSTFQGELEHTGACRFGL